MRFARDEASAVKLAAAAAVGALVAGELSGASGVSASLKPLLPVMLALLGMDQPSDVQRAGMQVRALRSDRKADQAIGIVDRRADQIDR